MFYIIVRGVVEFTLNKQGNMCSNHMIHLMFVEGLVNRESKELCTQHVA